MRRKQRLSGSIYAGAHREVRRSFKNDKRRYIDNRAEQAEEAAARRNMKELYDTTKKLAGKFQQENHTIKDKQRNNLTKTEDQLLKKMG